MINERYNGWANYETWNVALWYNNDECLYDEVFNRVRREIEHIDAEIAREIVQETFINSGISATYDGVKITDKKINWVEIAADLQEMISC